MNHHILTGKVDVTSNLLVGSSHLFVDTTNNRVGLVTADPDAGLHVNSNAYVNTDLRVGSQIEINTTPGRVKATSFEGDGSLLVNAPVGSLAVHSTDTGLPGTNAIVTNEGTPTAAEFKFVIPRGDVGATGTAATVSVGTTTTGAAGSSASVTNTGSSTAAVFDFTVPKGDQGIQGIQGIQGDTGTAATVTVGTTTTGAAGTNASVTNTGSSSAASFDFTIPRGDTGATGPAGTVAIGTTTTGAAGSSASVVNTGTSTAANLEFTVPKGDQGIQGVQGIQGIQGDTGPAGTVAIGTTTTGAAGSSASVTNTGTSTAANLEFTIPKGDQGIQGSAATIAIGTTTTGASGTNASVTNSGSSSAAVFDFTVPRGADGADGASVGVEYTEVDINAPASQSGTWTSATSSSWGDPKFNNVYDKYSYNDAPGYKQFNIPSGMKSAYISHLTWNTGGYADAYGVQSDGGLVFLRRINTHQAVENSNEGNPDQHDGMTITLAGSGLHTYSAIRLVNKSGRFHLTGLGFVPHLDGTEGAGMVNANQITQHSFAPTASPSFTGDVGIGKTPSEKLHVHENLPTSGHQIMARIGGDTSSYNTLVFGSKEGRPHIGGHRGDFGAWADLSFQNDLMILQQSTDRVGIGTSGPSGKLHIYEPTGTSHGVNVGTLILDHGNSGGSSSIVFPSRVNNTSDYAYITYNENYGEAGVSSSENGVLLLGAENDGTGSSDHVRVKTRLVVEADMTSSDPTYAFQVKSSNTTSDLFAVHRDGSIGINGIDLAVPLTINSNKTAVLGGSTRYTTYCRWYRGFGNWWIGSDNNTTWNHNLYWFANVNLTGNPLRKVITFENDQEKGTVVNVNTFTGQHRNIVKGVNPTSIESFIGLIVSADNNENIKVNGGVERGLEAITINETIPLVSVTTKAYDKQVFGVVSGSEDPDSRQDTYGRVTCSFLKEEGDDRIFINSLGEGAMWISNQNGPLESGDYVTSSHIPGYGMKQDSEFLANYTVAKITMDCDFQVTPRVKYRIKTELKTVNYFRHEESFLKESDYNKLEPDTQSDYTLVQYDENVNILDEYGQLQWEDSSETEAPYKVRYLLPDGTQISEEEYTTKALANEEVYIAAFVGCTYHCG